MPASMDGHEYAGRLGNLLQELVSRDGPAARLHIVTLGRFALSITGEHIGTARWDRPKPRAPHHWRPDHGRRSRYWWVVRHISCNAIHRNERESAFANCNASAD